MRKWIIGVLSIICFILIITTKQDVRASNSTFSVLIPKYISTSGNISVEADLDDYELLKVDVPQKVTLTDQVSKQTKDCYINTDKTSFTKQDIQNNIKNTNLNINTKDINAGKWQGNITVDVYISDVPLEGALDDWEYTIDDNTNTVYLNKYIGTKTDIKVYGVYQLNGKIYDTVLHGHERYSYLFYRNYYPVFDNIASSVTSITFSKGVKSITAVGLFNCCENLAELDLSNVKFENITDLTCMFYDCKNITSIKLGNRTDFNNVTCLDATFRKCNLLKDIDLGSNFILPNNTNMFYTFAECYELENLDFLKNIDTSNVTTMESTFNTCKKLNNIDGISKWNVSNCTTFKELFKDCKSLTNVDALLNWNTQKVTSFEGMFWECNNIINVLGMKYWNTEKVKTMCNMFYCAYNLKEIDFSNWNTYSLQNTRNMFYNTSIENIDLRNFYASNLIDMSGMFTYCSHLKIVNMANLDVSNVLYLNGMFCYANNIISIDLTRWNAKKCKNINAMFFGNYNLKEIKGIDTLLERDEYISTDIRCTFSNCVSLLELDLSKWKLKATENLYYTFYSCGKLTKLDFSGIDVSDVTNMTRLFDGCSNLQEIVGIEDWNVSKVKSFAYMFLNNGSLKHLDLSKWQTISATDNSNTEGGSNGFEGMFMNCTGLNYLNISSFTNPNGATCKEMLAGIHGLCGIEMDMSGFDFANSSDITDILYSTNYTLIVSDNDYDILQEEIDKERAKGPEDLLYTVLKRKT